MIPENINIFEVLKIALKAGEEILQVYGKDFSVEYKADNSPLTLADRQSNEVITGGLTKIYPEIPLLSEESKEVPYEERKSWEYFWLIDPLDGTKEFVKKNGEFTVNIALVFNGKPLLGVIYVPVKDTLYFGLEGFGSYKLMNSKKLDNCNNVEDVIAASQKLPISELDKPFTIVGSRSHMSDATREFIERKEAEYGNVDIMSIGSSLKLCMVAEGKADIYPRFGPTMEWDTAAGQAIVEFANGNVLETENNKSLEYNKENLLNPWFIVGRE
ncbi:MAG: 3'(2'),5'-bisphosphate nucleotidase CysQ [Candidatus Anammoxibacter sp.]